GGGEHRINRRNPNYRDVEAHVLIRFGYFDYGQPAAHQLTGATNHSVGSLHGLDRYAGAIANHDCLAEIEAGNLAGNLKSVLNISTLAFVRFTLCQSAGDGKLVFQKISRIDQFNSFGSQLSGHRAD